MTFCNKTQIQLSRRGFDLGSVIVSPGGNARDLMQAWSNGQAFKLESFLAEQLEYFTDSIEESHSLYETVIDKGEVDCLLAQPPYESRLSKQFEPLGAAFNEGNPQEIETVFFDGTEGNKITAEDLWLKVSLLSFFKSDKSVRFRFSFGVDFEEDVASDSLRQNYSAELAETIFQESKIVTENIGLREILSELLNSKSIKFVERIVYFNAPHGGAYLHHDRERGHAGVVYAQLSGSTFWLTLPRQELVAEIRSFVNELSANSAAWPDSIHSAMRKELVAMASKEALVIKELESFSNSALIHLINETPSFVQSLVNKGYGTHMLPGDVILLPQSSEDLCCWHSVFCVSDDVGEALSFAIRS